MRASQVAIKWLDENYNGQEYSLWKATYKYPEELTQGQLRMDEDLGQLAD